MNSEILRMLEIGTGCTKTMIECSSSGPYIDIERLTRDERRGTKCILGRGQGRGQGTRWWWYGNKSSLLILDGQNLEIVCGIVRHTFAFAFNDHDAYLMNKTSLTMQQDIVPITLM
jgi:hypothetical protein